MSVNNLLNIGVSSLTAHQVALNVTGNNVANIDTVGYSRQSVRFQESTPINWRPGQLGTGTYADEVYRNFNRFIENSYLARFTQQQRWAEESAILQNVESLFNEANRDGISSQLSTFFNNWSKLSTLPEDEAMREDLLAQADSLAALIRDTRKSLEAIQREMDSYINQTVNQVNSILEQLRDINKQIAITQTSANNPNALYDQRDLLVRELSELIDVRVDDKGGADFALFTESGQPLLHGDSVFTLEIQPAKVEKQTQNFTGDLTFSGVDSHEYTLEFVDGNSFRVSLDGGKSWLRNEDGTIAIFDVPPEGESIRIKNLDITFNRNEGDRFSMGDTFLIVPKTAVYWNSPTRDPINVTPQVYDDGTENPSRLTGGKLAAYFNIRDTNIGRYIDKLDAFANTLIWEVNMLHSQGAGLQQLTSLQGTYRADLTNVPLGGRTSGLTFADRLTEGNLTLHFYNEKTGESIFSGSLDFTNPHVDGGPVTNFDPARHSLKDVVYALNNSFPDPDNPGRNLITAAIVNGTLQISAAAGVTFNAGSDSTGLMAALGLNTFFQGNGAGDISVNALLRNNLAFINAQSVDGAIEANEGDGNIAARISQLATKEVRISTLWENSTQTLNGYYAGLVGLVGSDTRTAMFNEQYNTALADDLDERALAISGVNLDEEMSNLIRFQHSYTAAAKLITTADQMLETILGLKQ
ncbi:MAG: flagellar hook-associated protein FlgK [Desulfovibrionaceae bacterium]|nr:flagellar hook-associated protein FlgK [Desulfovibrionaceae bacterium]